MVSVQDTNVLILFLAHYNEIQCEKLLMKYGTFKHPNYIPVYEIRQTITDDQISVLLAFHPITKTA